MKKLFYWAFTVQTRGEIMKNKERGGIISNLLIIPVGVALMVGVFFLGYYVGRYPGKAGGQGENAGPLPEVISENLPKPQDFTFYKTLTAKGDKTVSIDLRPKPSSDKAKTDENQAPSEASKESGDRTAPKGKMADSTIEKKPSAAVSSERAAARPSRGRDKKETAPAKTAHSKLHYTVQVASYPQKQLADDEAKKMKTRGFAAFIVPSAVPGKGTWYRVRLGSFTSRASAERLAKEIHAKVGISPIITLE